MNTATIAIAAGLAAMTLGGCAASKASPEQVAAVRGTLGLGAEEHASSALTVEEAYPFVALRAGEAVDGAESREGDAVVRLYEVVEGEHKGKLLREERRAEGDDQWVVRTLLDGTETVLEERRFRLDAERGGLVLEDLRKVDRDVRVMMRPPPLSMPGVLDGGEEMTQQMELRLPSLKNPKSVRARGKGEMTLLHDAEQEVALGEERVRAKRVHEVFTNDLDAAKAVRTIERWFVPGVGLVAERWEEEVRVFGVVTERTRRTMRLVRP